MWQGSGSSDSVKVNDQDKSGTQPWRYLVICNVDCALKRDVAHIRVMAFVLIILSHKLLCSRVLVG